MARVCMVPYRRGWSYDINARGLAAHIPEIEIAYDPDDVRRRTPDLVVDMWWKGTLHELGFRTARQVSSHRWRHHYGQSSGLGARQFAKTKLSGLGAVLVPSERLRAIFAPHFQRTPVILCPKGFDPSLLGDDGRRRAGRFTVGWAGEDLPDKGLEILAEAADVAGADLRVADACLTQDEMRDFYNSVDAIAIASVREGDPRTLIEGMACGCFPIATDVGIVPELVRDRVDGLVVERSARAFAGAFAWCSRNLDFVRSAGRLNAETVLRSRTWARVAPAWRAAFEIATSR